MVPNTSKPKGLVAVVLLSSAASERNKLPLHSTIPFVSPSNNTCQCHLHLSSKSFPVSYLLLNTVPCHASKVLSKPFDCTVFTRIAPRGLATNSFKNADLPIR
ncbi:hypothetical protein TRVL_06090 [Trypanosoma vivax]|nr:hypothetical protein TRVL_06090 [Trypanosoma vivax]